MHYIVLKELPQGQQPGDLLDVHEDVGNILITVGAVRVATDAEVKAGNSRRSRQYRRRDMVAAEA